MSIHTTGEWKESETKKKWQKENTVFVGLKLQKKSDKDMLDYIERKRKENPNQSIAGLFKDALKSQMEREQENSEKL